MTRPVKQKKGERKSRRMYQGNRGKLELVMGLRGSIPLEHDRYRHHERVIGKYLEKPISGASAQSKHHLAGALVRNIARNHIKTRKIIIPKALEHVPIAMALKRTFRTMAGEGYFIDRKAKSEIRQAINQLHRNGKISFEVVEQRKLKNKRLPMRALPKAKKRAHAKAELEMKVPIFKIESHAALRGATNKIDSLISQKRGKEFRHIFKKYLLEEARETHWYLTEKVEKLVMDERERVKTHLGFQ